MSVDRREEIILLIISLLEEVEGISVVYRDRAELPTGKLPAIVVLDGKEHKGLNIGNNKFVQMPPSMQILSPQIFLILKLRDDLTNETLDGVAAPIGPELSAYRMKILQAMKDENLGLLLGTNGQVEYHGCDTDMQTGSTIGVFGAQIQFHFTFTYLLDPSDL